MKRMMLFILLAFMAIPAFAQEQKTTSQQLTEEIAQMNDAEKVEALKAIKAGESKSAARAREWIDIGNGLGEGLAATAQKLGVVANDFAKSPVGKMAMFLIVWNYMGEEISGWICGLLWWMITLPLWMYLFRKFFGEYNEKGKFIRLQTEMFNDRSTHGALTWLVMLSLCGILLVGIIFIA